MRRAVFLLTLLALSAPRTSSRAAGEAELELARAGLVAGALWPLVTRALVFTLEPLVLSEPPAPRALRLQVLGTTKRVDVEPFDPFGVPRPGAFDEIAGLFRAPSGDEVPIDPRLVDLLVRISERLGGRAIVIVSGHREPGRGTSKKSFHVSGMAADIAVPGVGVQEVRRAALAEGSGGVGLYPSFVHVDVRDVPYRWVGGRWPRRR